MRRTIIVLVAALLVIAGLGTAVVAGGNHSSVTRARLERSLPRVFSNLYADQADLLGHDAVTPASIAATAMCDKHGPHVADVGPGGDWVCLMGWSDPDVAMPAEGYGKFELNVHSNNCYTVTGPSKIVGFLTITDTRGREVPNPVFEFDGCFDPDADNATTGVSYPSLLSLTSTSLTPDAEGDVGLQVTCGAGSAGCLGTVTATAGHAPPATVRYRLDEQSTGTVKVPVADGTDEVSFLVESTAGVGPTSAVSLPVQRP